VTEPVTRPEFNDLRRRVDAMDSGGTRGVAVLGVQLQEVAKDVARLENQLQAHHAEHQAAEAARATGRRWLITAVIAAVAAIDGPIVTVVLARGGH
jgi:hypothetical protein